MATSPTITSCIFPAANSPKTAMIAPIVVRTSTGRDGEATAAIVGEEAFRCLVIGIEEGLP